MTRVVPVPRWKASRIARWDGTAVTLTVYAARGDDAWGTLARLSGEALRRWYPAETTKSTPISPN